MRKAKFLLLPMFALLLAGCDLTPVDNVIKTFKIENEGNVSEIEKDTTKPFFVKINGAVAANDLISWSIANNTSENTITDSGVFHAVEAVDSLYVVATYTKNTQIKDTMKIKVLTKDDIVVPTSLTIGLSTSNTIEVGVKGTISITTEPTDASKEVTYASSDSTVLVISNNKYTALKAGTATITATSKVATSVKDQKTITVLPAGTTDGYYKVQEYANYNLKTLADGNGMNTPNLFGNTKLLVVPVQLKNERSWTSTMLDRVEKGFFGESSETSWESVSSYYRKSSYGQLNMTGELADVVNINLTASSLSSQYAGYDGVGHVAYVAKQFYANSSAELLKEYDQDGDGFIDAIYFIYSNNFDGDDYWAWVYWLDGYDSSFKANKNKPNVNTHMWASYQFFEEGYGSSGIDAHTFIHETGHILGLDDYYDYDNDGAPMGAIDMMDNNIIDHNAYSKASLEWVKPYYVDGTKNETTITINSFTETGDFILVNDNWNGHALDEYLTIELYTPTGLNKKDSDAAYPGNNLRGYTVPGVRIIHVDSRAADLNSSDNFKNYTDKPTAGNSVIAAANSRSRTYATNSKFKLVHMMQATGKNTLSNNPNASATNNDLYKKGDVFEANSTFFVNGKNFNDGTPVGYRIEITALSASQATIKLTKI